MKNFNYFSKNTLSNYILNNNVCKCNWLNRVNSIKYLGLFINDKLKWDVHLNYINNSHGQCEQFSIQIYKSLKSMLNFELKKLTYIALIQSILSYGIFCWRGTYHTYFRDLEVTLNSLLKSFFNKPTIISYSYFI